MTIMRAYIFERRTWAMLLVAIALLVRGLVPAGYMVAPSALTLSVQICSDFQGEHGTIQIVVPRSGDGQDGSGDHNQKNPPCAFSALSMASMAGADGLLLAVALAFILAIGVTAVGSPVRRRFAHLRPPLRGPPSFT
jgi:hypothetical protein